MLKFFHLSPLLLLTLHPPTPHPSSFSPSLLSFLTPPPSHPPTSHPSPLLLLTLHPPTLHPSSFTLGAVGVSLCTHVFPVPHVECPQSP